MFQGKAIRGRLGYLALVTLTGLASGGCSDGVPSGRHGGDDFDRDDIQASVVECATEKRPSATVRVTANLSPADRTYFVRLNFLDDQGEVIDHTALKLDPESDTEDADEITENVEFSMSKPEKASEVASCEIHHAF